ncbi:MAG: hypothetical protein R6V58_02630 [Planctomycetota bacterium]
MRTAGGVCLVGTALWAAVALMAEPPLPAFPGAEGYGVAAAEAVGRITAK